MSSPSQPIEPPGTGDPCTICGCRLTSLDHRSKHQGGYAHIRCKFDRNAR